MVAPSNWNRLYAGSLAVLLMGLGQKGDAHGQQASYHTAVRLYTQLHTLSGAKHAIILEIRDILDSTRATAYFDRKAAAKYLVYDASSWIS
jgi:hypothetical protein